MSEEYGVHATFNVMDLTLFTSSEDEEAKTCDFLRQILFKREGLMEEGQA